MACILSIESSTSVCSVAIHDQGKVIALMELHQENVHSRELMLIISSLLERSNLDAGKLEAIAISKGPGSYTGLRIGFAIAKGLAFAKDIPLIGVDTTRALAKRILPLIENPSKIIPLLDAKRMEVYAAVFDHELVTLEKVAPRVIESENPFLDYLNGSLVYFLGDGVEKLKEILNHPNARFLKNMPSAESIGYLAFEKFQKGQFEDIAYFEPNYLKDFRVIKSKKNPLLS